MKLTDSLPFYVTRKNADGIIATYSISAWTTLFAAIFFFMNVIVWGFIGLVLAAILIVNTVADVVGSVL